LSIDCFVNEEWRIWAGQKGRETTQRRSIGGGGILRLGDVLSMQLWEMVGIGILPAAMKMSILAKEPIEQILLSKKQER